MTGAIDRRSFAGGIAAASLLAAGPATSAASQLRTIRASGERLPVIGMGSWRTFDVGSDAAAIDVRANVLRAFFAAGGRVIDSSPMYGSAQSVIGAALRLLGSPTAVFAADKVWTTGRAAGLTQIGESRRRWGVARFNLLQIHNLLDWREHLKTLVALKAEGRVNHIGVTSYDGIRYDEIEQVMRGQPIDFVQFSYNVADRRAESRLLPLAADRGIAVIVNRPFQEGALFDRVAGRQLPGYARELGAQSWAELMLKFIVSHPAVTVAIPATSRVDHMRQNMRALTGALPDARMRARIAADFAS
jgi:diketogulonate reductase-like aldo/keto reductase